MISIKLFRPSYVNSLICACKHLSSLVQSILYIRFTIALPPDWNDLSFLERALDITSYIQFIQNVSIELPAKYLTAEHKSSRQYHVHGLG